MRNAIQSISLNEYSFLIASNKLVFASQTNAQFEFIIIYLLPNHDIFMQKQHRKEMERESERRKPLPQNQIPVCSKLKSFEIKHYWCFGNSLLFFPSSIKLMQYVSIAPIDERELDSDSEIENRSINLNSYRSMLCFFFVSLSHSPPSQSWFTLRFILPARSTLITQYARV